MAFLPIQILYVYNYNALDVRWNLNKKPFYISFFNSDEARDIFFHKRSDAVKAQSWNGERLKKHIFHQQTYSVYIFPYQHMHMTKPPPFVVPFQLARPLFHFVTIYCVNDRSYILLQSPRKTQIWLPSSPRVIRNLSPLFFRDCLLYIS